MSFEEYAQANRVRLVRFANALAGDPSLGEDLVQRALTKAFERWTQIGAVDLPHAYVRRMIVNDYLSWRRALRRFAPDRDLSDLVLPEPDHAGRLALLQAVLALPPKQRAAVVLRYYEGLPDDEIAVALSCGPSAVRSNIARALASLRVRAGIEDLIRE